MAITSTPSQFDPPPLRFHPLHSHKGKFPMVTNSAEEYPRQYLVNNLSQADFGRRKLERAKVDIPGLTAFQNHYGSSKPLNGVTITCSLDITPQTGVLVEALTAIGANVRLCSSSISSTDDHVAAALARRSASVFAVRGQTVEQNLSCMSRALEWGPSSGGPDLILDDGGVLTRLIHEGVIAEQEFARTGAFPDPKSTDDHLVNKAMLTVISESLKSDPMKYNKIMDGLVGFTINNSRAAIMFLQMQMDQTLLFPVINVNESVSKGRAIIVVAEGGPMNLSCNTGPPSVAKSFSLTTQLIALLELWKERSSGKYEKKVYEFPKHLAELVTALHHENHREDQADHISLEVEGDHQPANNVQVEGDNNDRDRAGQCLKVFGLVVSVFGLVASCVGVMVGVSQLARLWG